MRAYMREQKHICGANYMEVDIFPVSEREHRAGARAKKARASSLVQANHNHKMSKRHLLQLFNANFTPEDVHVVLPYFTRYKPKSLEQAERDLDNYIRRVNYLRAKRGYPPAKVIAVIEWQEPDDHRKKVEYHHHVIISGDALSRDELEALWSVGRERDISKRRRLGWANADRLRFDQDSLDALTKYILKYPQRKKRWRQSVGLKQPKCPRPNDGRYTHAKVAKIARERVDDADFWHRQYPGWELNGPAVEAQYYEETGWHLYLRMRRVRPVRKKE